MEMVATDVVADAQVTELLRFAVEPSVIGAGGGELLSQALGDARIGRRQAIDLSAAAVTVSPVVPVMPSKVAEIVTGPGETAVASPVLLIVAQVVSEEAQVTWLVRSSVELSDKVPVAVNCSVSPGGQAGIGRSHGDRLEDRGGDRQPGRAA